MRLDTIAYAAFEQTTHFTWMNPKHDCWPDRILALERLKVSSVMRTNNHVVLIALDAYDPDEAAKANVYIAFDDRAPPPSSHWTSGRAVVGLAVWKFKDGSARPGEVEEKLRAGLCPRLATIKSPPP